MALKERFYLTRTILNEMGWKKIQVIHNLPAAGTDIY